MTKKFTYDWLKLCAVALALAGTGALGMTYTYYRGLTNNPNNAPLKTAVTSTKSVDKTSTSKADVSKSTEPTSFRLSQIPGILSRQTIDSSGFSTIVPATPWNPNASLKQIKQHWIESGNFLNKEVDRVLAFSKEVTPQRVAALGTKASLLLSEGKADQAYSTLQELRSTVQAGGLECMQHLQSTTVFFQGIAALRLGENENCVMCRGESSCILPLQPSAVHKKTRGSRLAIEHFTEYLEVFPDDLEVRWLLNLAHMTLGEYPDKVEPEYLIKLTAFENNVRFAKFTDVAEKAGINRFDQAGGAIFDDFDGDGRIDLVESTWDVKEGLSIYRNTANGKFEECMDPAIKDEQLGGLQIMQTDYNNDGRLDVYIVRGAWIQHSVRPSLLRNDGNMKFTDVTAESGLMDSFNSNSAQWSDYNNDGCLDLFVCCERQRHRLYKNMGDGTFKEVLEKSGFNASDVGFGKGCTWIDYNNDGYSDLFINYLDRPSQLFHNNGDETFRDVTLEVGIEGPTCGFSCWAWDFNNDGFEDIFATSYDRTLKDIVKGMMGLPHELTSNRLYLNENGKRFRDVTKEAGLDLVFATMGSNFGDLDNDGWLDFYLATGEPSLATLVPNRMFKSEGGQRFVEVTTAAGVGHLQKGHAVSFGDWDHDGDNDVFVQMGGAVDGDRFRNILFSNPGNSNNFVTLKLAGTTSNKAAIGAKLKIVTDGPHPMTIYRTISSGSSFGGNALQQTIGLGDATKIASIQIKWPGSSVTEEFYNVDAGKSYFVTEGTKELKLTSLALLSDN